jgi:hypothetical protein
MMPLGSLTATTDSIHADHVKKNVWSILEGGGSLPLVFPMFELGFSYCPDGNVEKDESGDTAGYFPRLKIGHRMPHVLVEVLASPGSGRKVLETLYYCPDASSSDPDTTSLTDISAQLRRAQLHSSPLFTLLAVGPALTRSTSPTGEAVNRAMKKWAVSLMLVNIFSEKTNVAEHQSNVKLSGGLNVVYTVDAQQALLQLLHLEQQDRQQKNAGGALIMVRPDGHIANMSWIDERGDLDKQIEQAIEQGFINALGI